jgi:hypothetical protein
MFLTMDLRFLWESAKKQSAVSNQKENLVADENDSNRHNDLLKAESRQPRC